MPIPTVTLDFQSPLDVCERCGATREGHGEHRDRGCGMFTKAPSPLVFATPAAQELLERHRRLRNAAPELAAALGKVTAKFRLLIESETAADVVEWVCAEGGVLEAEALLKRIDEGGDRSEAIAAANAKLAGDLDRIRRATSSRPTQGAAAFVFSQAAEIDPPYMPPSDLDAFRAMLERAGIYVDVAEVMDGRRTLTGGVALCLPGDKPPAYKATFVFDAAGHLKSID